MFVNEKRKNEAKNEIFFIFKLSLGCFPSLFFSIVVFLLGKSYEQSFRYQDFIKLVNPSCDVTTKAAIFYWFMNLTCDFSVNNFHYDAFLDDLICIWFSFDPRRRYHCRVLSKMTSKFLWKLYRLFIDIRSRLRSTKLRYTNYCSLV